MTPFPIHSEGVPGITRDLQGRVLPFVEIRVAPLLRAGESGVMLALSTVSTLRSDAGGRFELRGLPPGSYQLVARKGGYAVLIGQVNTLLQSSLDLVLHPSGPPAAPGTRPEDASWALRLPTRDILESSERTAVQAAGRRDSPRMPIQLQISDSRMGVGGDSANGEALELGGYLPLGPGAIGAGLHYRLVGDGQELSEEQSGLRFGWSGQPNSRTHLAISIEANRNQREQATLYASDLHRSRLSLAASYDDGSGRHDWRVTLGTLHGGETDQAAVDKVDARWAFAQYGYERSFAEQTVRAYGALRSAANAWRGRASGPGDAIPSAVIPSAIEFGDPGNLGAAAAAAAEVGANDQWQALPTLAVISRGRAEYAAGFDAGTRSAASIGAEWQPTGSLTVRGEVGQSIGHGRDLIWQIVTSGGGGNWSWSIGRAHESGVAPWNGDRSKGVSDALVIYGREASIDSWSARLERSGKGLIPHTSLELVRREGEGMLSGRFADDRWIVPVVGEGSAKESRATLTVALPASGTELQLSYALVSSISGSALLDGAHNWEETSLSLHQQLAALNWRGATTSVVLAYTQAGLDRAGSSFDEARRAWLELHRLSGGIALSF